MAFKTYHDINLNVMVVMVVIQKHDIYQATLHYNGTRVVQSPSPAARPGPSIFRPGPGQEQKLARAEFVRPDLRLAARPGPSARPISAHP